MWLNTKCNHKFVGVGLFYKETFTEYVNRFDQVVVYKKSKCSVCGKTVNTALTWEDFLPQLHKGREARRDEYIKKLKAKGIVDEVDLLCE